MATKTTTKKAAAAKSKAPSKTSKAKAVPAADKKEDVIIEKDEKKSAAIVNLAASESHESSESSKSHESDESFEGQESSESSASHDSNESHESQGSSELSESHESNESSEDFDTEEFHNRGKLLIVIPYKASSAKGDELKYALRSWAKNLPEAEILIIGDLPEFASHLVAHIPAVITTDNPQVDIASKLMQAIASDLVPDFFIFSNDDIYLTNPITPEELCAPKIAGLLGETKRKANPKYAQKIEATLKALKDAGLNVYDYSTHLPFLYHKKELAEVIRKFKAEENGLLISSLYFNSTLPDYTPEVTKGNASGDHVVYVYRENPNLSVVEHGFTDRKFVNHNSVGYASVLPFLKKYFPEKSRFEK